MPPVTPSPHRFLLGQRRQPSPPKTAKSATAKRSVSATREETPQQRRAPAQHDATPQRPVQEVPSTLNKNQFAQTPRFSFGRPSSRPRSPRKPSLAQALRRSIRPTEDVLEAPAANPDDEEMLVVEQAEAWPTTESTQTDHPEWTNELPYSPKRRKFEDAHHPLESPARPMFKHPTTPASHYTSAAHNFIRTGSVASSVASNDTILSRRPAFLRSSVAPQEQFEPLPEAFSPHRRGEKFLPGGMAATLQQWVIETGQAAAQSRRGQGYLGGEDFVFRLEIESLSGSDPILVHGRRWDKEARIILVANAKRGVEDVAPGSVVGVRAPTWEVELEGEVWNVGVDWKVVSWLSGG